LLTAEELRASAFAMKHSAHLATPVVQENRLSLDASDDDVVQCPRSVYAGLASHKSRISVADNNINKSRTSLIFHE
jgi:hypothetical protein